MWAADNERWVIVELLLAHLGGCHGLQKQLLTHTAAIWGRKRTGISPRIITHEGWSRL
jgi:hypothetical protein